MVAAVKPFSTALGSVPPREVLSGGVIYPRPPVAVPPPPVPQKRPFHARGDQTMTSAVRLPVQWATTTSQ